MPRTPMSEVSSKRTGAERVRRWRCRRAAFRHAHDELARELGREPTEAEMVERLEQELGRAGMQPATTDDGPRAAEQTFATAAAAFELRIAAERGKIFDLVMAAAEAGDISATLWLASRLAPAARSRRYVRLPEIQDCDLAAASGVERAIELLIQATAAGRVALEDSEPLLRALGQRLDAAERVAKAEAYTAARTALEGGGGLPDRLETLRRQLAVAVPTAETTQEPEMETAPWH